MPKLKIAALVTAAALGFAPALQAENHTPDAGTVVATVNGTEITLGHMVAMRESLPEQYRQLPPATLFQGILDQLIDQALLAGRTDGQMTPRMELMLDNQRRSMLAAREMAQMMADGMTDEAIQALYDEKYATVTGTEWNASHILVETEEEAQAIIDELNGGADFATVAREKSTGPSGPNGGQLGWFGPGMMVAPFEQAVAAMEAETISAPVQTQFGWHVIRLNETREKGAPPLAEVRGQLAEELRGQIVQDAIDAARESAEITREGETLDPALLVSPGILGD